MRTWFRSSCLLIGVLALSPVPKITVAQTSKGTIAGTITDPAGGAISSATVTAQSTQLGENRSTVSGTYGEYRISAVLPGIYQVKVTANGFATVVLDNVEVGASVEKSLDVRMEVSSSSQTITVESSGATLQTESAELSGSISKTEIQQLPINSLNPISLVLTEPGAVRVSQRDDFTNGASFSVDGLRPSGQQFLDRRL